MVFNVLVKRLFVILSFSVVFFVMVKFVFVILVSIGGVLGEWLWWIVVLLVRR